MTVITIEVPYRVQWFKKKRMISPGAGVALVGEIPTGPARGRLIPPTKAKVVVNGRTLGWVKEVMVDASPVYGDSAEPYESVVNTTTIIATPRPPKEKKEPDSYFRVRVGNEETRRARRFKTADDARAFLKAMGSGGGVTCFAPNGKIQGTIFVGASDVGTQS